MEHIRILLLGVSFRVYVSYKISRPHGTCTHTSIRVYVSYKICRPHGTYTHTSIRVSFRVYVSYKNSPAPWNIYAYFYQGFQSGLSYISYKIRTRQKSEKDWKSGNCRNAWSPQRVYFSDWFFQKFVLDHANTQMYQSHKTLRLRREMSLPLTFIRPFRDNPQSCLLVYQRVYGMVGATLPV